MNAEENQKMQKLFIDALREAGDEVIAESKSVGGHQWTSMDRIKLDAPVRHPALPENLVERIKKICAVFEEVYPVPIEQAIDNFSRDTHPEKEVRDWEAMAEAYEQYIRQNPSLPLAAKKELLVILLDGPAAPERPGGFKYFDRPAVLEIAGKLKRG